MRFCDLYVALAAWRAKCFSFAVLVSPMAARATIVVASLSFTDLASASCSSFSSSHASSNAELDEVTNLRMEELRDAATQHDLLFR